MLVRLGQLGRIGGTRSGPRVPPGALTFSDNTPLQFSDGQYLELAA